MRFINIKWIEMKELKKLKLELNMTKNLMKIQLKKKNIILNSTMKEKINNGKKLLNNWCQTILSLKKVIRYIIKSHSC